MKANVIFALPRGGVPVGREVANLLNAPLEVLVVRKIGAPLNPEYGIGAIAEDGSYWIDPNAARLAEASPSDIQRTASQEYAEVIRRIEYYRGGRPLRNMLGKAAIVVDDGLATGVTARVACHFLKNQHAEQVTLAVPVSAAETAEALRKSGVVDELVCLEEHELFYAVGQFYDDFRQVTDEDVVSLLSEQSGRARKRGVF